MLCICYARVVGVGVFYGIVFFKPELYSGVDTVEGAYGGPRKKLGRGRVMREATCATLHTLTTFSCAYATQRVRCGKGQKLQVDGGLKCRCTCRSVVVR